MSVCVWEPWQCCMRACTSKLPSLPGREEEGILAAYICFTWVSLKATLGLSTSHLCVCLRYKLSFTAGWTWNMESCSYTQPSRAEISGPQVTGEAVLGQSSWRRQPLPLLFTSLNVCLLVKPYLMVRTLYSSLLWHWRKNLTDTHSLRPAPQLHSLSGQSKEAQNCILMLHGVRIEG